MNNSFPLELLTQTTCARSKRCDALLKRWQPLEGALRHNETRDPPLSPPNFLVHVSDQVVWAVGAAVGSRNRGYNGAEFGALVGAVCTVRGIVSLRFGSVGGLAGEQSAEAIPRLAEAAAAGSADGHAEEAGLGLSR